MTASQITDLLWVGDIQDAREESTDQFDRIVSVCQDEVSDNVGCEYDWFNMADGPMCGYGGDSSYELFYEAAKCVLDAMRRGETVLVHCHMGQSRSVSVAAAALSVLTDTSIEAGYNSVWEFRGDTHPEQLLQDHAEKFVRCTV